MTDWTRFEPEALEGRTAHAHTVEGTCVTAASPASPAPSTSSSSRACSSRCCCACTAGVGGSPEVGIIWRFSSPGMGRMA